MIHLALVLVAFMFLCWFALFILGLIGAAFEQNSGCGCMTIVVVIIAVIVFLCW